MLDFFRGRYSWRKLGVLVRQISSSSKSLTFEAMVNDEELAESMAEPSDDDEGKPRMSEYTPDVARLDVILDRLSELISVTIAVAGGKAPRVRPASRPETAFMRVQKRKQNQKFDDLISEVEAAQARWVDTK